MFPKTLSFCSCIDAVSRKDILTIIDWKHSYLDKNWNGIIKHDGDNDDDDDDSDGDDGYGDDGDDVNMWKTCATNDWWLGCKLEH